MSTNQGNMEAAKTVFMLCDVQEKFKPAISHFDDIVTQCKKLMSIGELLGVPLFVTEQNPDKLGKTVPELDLSRATYVEAKTKFSMVSATFHENMERLHGKPNAETVCVIMGIEAHVCVEQTAAELIQQGYTVHVVADAVSSRSQEDRILALRRLTQIGCFVSTAESIIFKLVRDSKHPHFREISALVKQRAPPTGLSSL